MRVRNIVILLVVLAVLGGVYLIVSQPEPEDVTPVVYVWDVDMDEIERIEISLPHEGLSQAFIKIPQGDQFPWFFEDGSPVDVERWGGGIPLLLSGPVATRVITENATDEKLAEYGLLQPSMEITLTLSNGDIVETYVGDSTIDGVNYYVRAPDSNAVATVDYTWYEVLENLVLDPPYVSAEEQPITQDISHYPPQGLTTGLSYHILQVAEGKGINIASLQVEM